MATIQTRVRINSLNDSTASDASDANFTIVVPTTLAGIAYSPASVRGGKKVWVTVTMTGPAPSGGFNVNLSNDHPSLIHKMPKQIQVTAGQTAYRFQIGTGAVKKATMVEFDARGQDSSVASNKLQLTKK